MGITNYDFRIYDLMKSNEVDLRLIVCDFDDITHNEIDILTGIQPTYIRVKGQPKNSKRADSPVWTNNVWSIGSGLGTHTSFQEQMDILLDIIEEKIEVFQQLSSKYYIEFACALKVYRDNGESTPSVHLDERYNCLIKKLNIEFDIDLYVF